MKPRIFDSHAHYDSHQFDEDRDALLALMAENNIGTIVNSAADWDSLTEVVELAQKHAHVYAAVGLHPDEVKILDEEKFSFLKEQCKKEKVVAVGEIGLDYYWDNTPRDVQEMWFVRQLDLARELELPVIIHSRDAAEDTLRIMKQYANGLRGVIHCFSYSKELADEYVKMGFYIGIGGVVTFKNGKKLKEIAREIPLERILLETDCPYLAPHPHRGKINHSGLMSLTAQKLAQITGLEYGRAVQITRNNVRDLFGV